MTSGYGTVDALNAALAEWKPGQVFTTHDLLAAGLGTSRTALDVALKRLVDKKAVLRAGRGVFYIPERHPVLGPLPPAPEHLAEALARRTGAKLLPVSPGAAHRLGLSTQVAGRAVFYTTGRGGRRQLGNRTIELRHRSPSLAGVPAVVGTVIEALRSLGPARAASPAVHQRLVRSLSAEDKQHLEAALHLAPGWMRPILYALWR